MQEVITDDREIVTALRQALAERIGAERYEMWFGGTTRIELRGDRLVISVPNVFLQEWLRNNFRGQLEAVVCDVVSSTATVAFEVDPKLTPKRAPKPNRTRPSPDQILLSFAAESAATADGGPKVSLPAVEAADTNPSAAAMPNSRCAQPRRSLEFDGFVVGTSNRLAYASALGCVERPGSISPLLITGPTGVGKSHLLESVVEAARRSSPEIRAALLSAEQFTASFLEALHGAGLPSFRRKFRGLHVLAIDDLQFLAGKRATLVELVHTIDHLHRDGKQVVVASDRSPADMAFLGPELRNRLLGGLVVGIEPPDMQTRVGIVGRMATSFGMRLSADVAEFVAASFSAHARELAGALKRLLAAARAYDRAIDLNWAREILADLARQQQKAVRLADIDKAVCNVFGLEADTLQSPRKGKDVSHPRMLAMWLARKYTRSALSEIGRYFGGRSHSTVVSAQKRVTDWLGSEEPLQTAGGRCRFEEALRRVEQTLQAG